MPQDDIDNEGSPCKSGRSCFKYFNIDKTFLVAEMVDRLFKLLKFLQLMVIASTHTHTHTTHTQTHRHTHVTYTVISAVFSCFIVISNYKVDYNLKEFNF